MASKQVLLPFCPASVAAVRIHPVVLFTICDGYIRRNKGQERIIGTLMGTVSEGAVYEVKTAFVLPHREDSASETVSLNEAQFKTQLELHQRVAPSDVIVGW
jgi:translation initiation factor 3 subunit F